MKGTQALRTQVLDLEALRARQVKLASQNRARLTLDNYGRAWKKYERWCAERGISAMPTTDENLSLYLVHLLEVLHEKVTSAQFYAAGVVYKHRAAGLVSPFGPKCKAVIGATRRLRKEKPDQRAPITIEQLRKISKAYAAQGTTRAILDRAIIVFGFACAMRRSNLVALQLSDITFTDEGVIVKEQSSKTDQFGKGRQIGVFKGSHRETCPVRCLKAWLRIRGQWSGPLFCNVYHGINPKPLSGDYILRTVKEAISMIGLDPKQYGAHSLRAGFVTEAVEAGASDFAIMRITGHRQVETLKRYVRPVTVFPKRNIFAGAL